MTSLAFSCYSHAITAARPHATQHLATSAQRHDAVRDNAMSPTEIMQIAKAIKLHF